MASPVSKLAMALAEFSKKAFGPSYDPKTNVDLFGKDTTEELVDAIDVVLDAKQARRHIIEAVKTAIYDPESKFGNLMRTDRRAAVTELRKVYEWADKEYDFDFGNPQAAAVQDVKSLVYLVSSNDNVRIKTEEDPELVGAQPVTDEELNILEIPPESLSMEEYLEHRSQRKTKKTQIPLRYQTLKRTDVGADADLRKIYRVIKFFLGEQPVIINGKPGYRGVIESPSSGMAEAEKKDLVYRLLAGIRDAKIQAWKTARDKQNSGQPLTADDQRHLKYMTETTLNALGGKEKRLFDSMVNAQFSKDQKFAPVEQGDLGIATGRAKELHDMIVSLRSYLTKMKFRAKKKTVTDESGKSVEQDVLDEKGKPVERTFGKLDKNMEPVVDEHGNKVEEVSRSSLRNALLNLKKYMETSGETVDTIPYNEQIRNIEQTIESANLSDEEKAAVKSLFPVEIDKTSMKHPSDALEDSSSDLVKLRAELNKNNEDIERSHEDAGKLESLVKEISDSKVKYSEYYRDAKKISDDLSENLFRSLHAIFPMYRRVNYVGGRKVVEERTLDEFVYERLDAIGNILLDKYSASYGEDNVKSVIDFAKKYASEYIRQKNLMDKLKMSGDVGQKVYNKLHLEKKIEQLEKVVQGLTQLKKREDEPGVKAIFNSGEALVDFVRKSQDAALAGLDFDEIKILMDHLNNVRLALISFSKIPQSKKRWKSGDSTGTNVFEDILSEDPENWMEDLTNSKLLKYLEDKSAQMALGSKGDPESVPGPGFDIVDTEKLKTGVDFMIETLASAVQKLKKYDPDNLRAKIISSALSKALIGVKLRSREDQAKKRQRIKEQRQQAKQRQKPEQQTTSPVEKAAGLFDMLRVFMAKFAAIRTAVNKGDTHWLYHSKREKKSGPVYLQPFFIDPDGVDEFMEELAKQKYSFMDSVRDYHSWDDSPDKTLSDEDRAKKEQARQQRLDIPGPSGAGRAGRGFNLNLNDMIAKTMFKGSNDLREHILKNKDRMAAMLSGRLESDEAKVAELEDQLRNLTMSLNSRELTSQAQFLEELAQFINDPEAELSGAVSEAFPSKVRSERHKVFKNISGRLLELKEIKRKLEAKYKNMDVDPTTMKDYNNVVATLDKIEAQFPGLDLNEMAENISNYDRMNSYRDHLQRVLKHEKDSGRVMELSSELENLEIQIGETDEFLSKIPAFRRMQKLYPASAKRQGDEPTEEIYKKVRDMPERPDPDSDDISKEEVIKQQDERLKELREIEEWEDFSNWLRKLQKSEKKSPVKDVPVELARARLLLKNRQQKLDAATAAYEKAPAEDKSKYLEGVEKWKGEVAKIKAEIEKGEVALVRSKSRKESDFVKPGEHEPKQNVQLWNKLISTVEDTIRGKKKFYPKMLVDVLQEVDLRYIEKNEVVDKLEGLKKRLENLGADFALVHRNALGSKEDWNATRDEALKELDRMKAEAASKEKALQEAEAKFQELSQGSDVEGKEEAERALKNAKVEVEEIPEKVARIRKLVFSIDSIFFKQKSMGSKVDLSEVDKIEKQLAEAAKGGRMVGENFVKNMTDEGVKKAIDNAMSKAWFWEDTDPSDIGMARFNSSAVRKIMNMEELVTENNKWFNSMLEKLNTYKESVEMRSLDDKDRKALSDRIQKAIDNVSKFIVKFSPSEYVVDKVVQDPKLDEKLKAIELKERAAENSKWFIGVVSILDNYRDRVNKKLKAAPDDPDVKASSVWIQKATDDANAYHKADRSPSEYVTDKVKQDPKLEKLLKEPLENTPDETKKPLIYEEKEKEIRSLIHKSLVHSQGENSSSNAEKIKYDIAIKDVEKFLKQYPAVSGRVAPFALSISEEAKKASTADDFENLLLSELAAERKIESTLKYVKEGIGLIHDFAGILLSGKHGNNPVKEWSKLRDRYENFREVLDDIRKHFSGPNSIRITALNALKDDAGNFKVLDTESGMIPADKWTPFKQWFKDVNEFKETMVERIKKIDTVDKSIPKSADPGKAPQGITRNYEKWYGQKKAAEDPKTVDWIPSAGRKYLEDIPATGIKDWIIIQTLFGQKQSEYKDLVKKGQLAIDSGNKETLRKLMGEVNTRVQELVRMKALADAKVEIGGKKIRVSDVGDVFNRELSQYLTNKNELLLKQAQVNKDITRYKHQIDFAKEFVGTDATGKAEMKKELTDREMQSIIDQLYRGLFWYLQDYWSTNVGREAVFGAREAPEFSELYDTFKAFSGVRSNPTIQKVIRAGSEARKHLRTVNMAIGRISRGMKTLGQDPEEVVKNIKDRYGVREGREVSLPEVEKQMKAKRDSMDRTTSSGVTLYMLMKHKEQLERQLEQKNAMYRLLNESASEDYKIQVLNNIKAATQDPSLVSEIDKQIALITEDKNNKVFTAPSVSKAVEEINRTVTEALKEVEELETIKGALDVEQEAAKQEKQASYKNHPSFDAGVFYGSILQSKIAEMAARILRARP